MLLQENITLLGFSELIAGLELALGYRGAELFAAPLELQDLLAANPVLDVVSPRYNSHGIPFASGFGGPCLCRQDVIQVSQCAFALGFTVDVEDLILQAKLGLRVCEVLDAAVDVSFFEVWVELIVESEIETAVLVFRDNAPAELARSLVTVGANDLALIDFPASIEDFIVRRTLPAVQCLAVEEQFPTLADLSLCQRVRLLLDLRLVAGNCITRHCYQCGEEDRCSARIQSASLHYRTPFVDYRLSHAAEHLTHISTVAPTTQGSLPITGRTQHADNPLELRFWSPMKNCHHMNWNKQGPVSQWYDDFELWSGFPPGHQAQRAQP